MKIGILYLSIFILFLSKFDSFAQATVEIPQKSHHFGQIAENEGSVTHRFIVINQGDEPLVIQKVIPDCGCTTPQWTLKPIATKDTGSIDITFQPENRKGHFKKTITVHTNGNPPIIFLEIEGEVVQKKNADSSQNSVLQPIELKHFFEYDEKEFSVNDLQKIENEVIKYYELKKQPIAVKIVGSASRVPTKKFTSNQALAEARAKQAALITQNWLKQIQVPHQEIEQKTQVIGKKYAADAQKNKRLYQQFQYITVTFF